MFHRTLDRWQPLSLARAAPQLPRRSPGREQPLSRACGAPRPFHQSPGREQLLSRARGAPRLSRRSAGIKQPLSRARGALRLLRWNPGREQLLALARMAPALFRRTSGRERLLSRTPGAPPPFRRGPRRQRPPVVGRADGGGGPWVAGAGLPSSGGRWILHRACSTCPSGQLGGNPIDTRRDRAWQNLSPSVLGLGSGSTQERCGAGNAVGPRMQGGNTSLRWRILPYYPNLCSLSTLRHRGDFRPGYTWHNPGRQAGSDDLLSPSLTHSKPEQTE